MVETIDILCSPVLPSGSSKYKPDSKIQKTTFPQVAKHSHSPLGMDPAQHTTWDLVSHHISLFISCVAHDPENLKRPLEDDTWYCFTKIALPTSRIQWRLSVFFRFALYKFYEYIGWFESCIISEHQLHQTRKEIFCWQWNIAKGWVQLNKVACLGHITISNTNLN